MYFFLRSFTMTLIRISDNPDQYLCMHLTHSLNLISKKSLWSPKLSLKLKSEILLKIQSKYKGVLLEAVQNMRYSISLELERMKGQPLTKARKTLTSKQKKLEELQRYLSSHE